MRIPAPCMASAAAALLLVSCLGSEAPESQPQAADFILEGVSNLTPVAQLTGKDSMNRTDRVGVFGTDLGSMFEDGERTYFLFGDTFGLRPASQIGAGGENWRSNTMAWSTDRTPEDGIAFDGWIVNDAGSAKELLPSKKVDRDEITVIPTNGVSVGGALYIFFMSVSHWGAPGFWDCGYSGIARSTDRGQTWQKLGSPRWPGGSNFVQVAISRQNEDLLIWSIPSGRHGGVALMTVPAAEIEHGDRYRYFAGCEDGQPRWSGRMQDAVTIVKPPVGELSVAWNPWLGRWIMTCLNEETHNLEIREGMAPWGPWGQARMLVSARRYPGLYGAFMNPSFTANGGKTISFTMSQWSWYNVFLMRADLDRAAVTLTTTASPPLSGACRAQGHPREWSVRLRLVPVRSAGPVVGPVVGMPVLDCDADGLLEHHGVLDVVAIVADLSLPVVPPAEDQSVIRRAVFLRWTPCHGHVVFRAGSVQGGGPFLPVDEDHVIPFSRPVPLGRLPEVVDVDVAPHVVSRSRGFQDDVISFPVVLAPSKLHSRFETPSYGMPFVGHSRRHWAWNRSRPSGSAP